MVAAEVIKLHGTPRSLAERAYQMLVRKITRLELPPGDIVNERQLIVDLAIGRTPIREALYRLVGEGLLIHHPNRGMFVAEINSTSVRHIYEFRQLVEIEAVRLAASRASQADIADLSAIGQKILDAANAEDIDLYIDLDRMFYAVLSRAAENVFLREAIPQLFNHHLRLWFYIASKHGGWRDIMAAHAEMVREVIAGLSERDQRRASQAVSKYIAARCREASAAI